MTQPVAVPGTGLGVLWRATVKKVESTPSMDAAYVDCPALARGAVIGPLPTLAPGLAAGDGVLIGCIGLSRQDMVVIARTSARWPNITEVPGLADALENAATNDELTRLADRMDGQDIRDTDVRTRLWEIQTQLGRTTSKVEEVPDALARQRAERIAVTDALAATDTANAQAATSALRTALYGASYRTANPQAELRTTQDIGGLVANNDYILSTYWGITRDSESAAGRTPMAVIGTGDAAPTTITIPTDGDGDYDIEYVARSTATSGQLALKVMLNAPTTGANSTKVGSYSVYSDVGFATLNEGTRAIIKQTARLAAGDKLTFGIWSSVAFTITAAYFGGIRTRIRVMRRPY